MKWRKTREREDGVEVITSVHFTREDNETDERILLAVGLACLQLKTRDLPQICATKMIGESKDVELQEAAHAFGSKIQLKEMLKLTAEKVETVVNHMYVHWADKNRRPSLYMDYVNSVPVSCVMRPGGERKYWFNAWSFCNGVESSVDEICNLAKALLDEKAV